MDGIDAVAGLLGLVVDALGFVVRHEHAVVERERVCAGLLVREPMAVHGLLAHDLGDVNLQLPDVDWFGSAPCADEGGEGEGADGKGHPLMALHWETPASVMFMSSSAASVAGTSPLAASAAGASAKGASGVPSGASAADASTTGASSALP